MRRFLIRAFGLLVTAAAIAYFIHYCYEALAGADLSALLDKQTLLACSVLVAMYTLCILPNAAGWHVLMRALEQQVRFSLSLRVLAVTQIGKYLPGNIAHHLGRIALMRSHGVKLSAGAYSLGYEVILASLVSLHVGTSVLLWKPPALIIDHPLMAYKLPILVSLTLGAVTAILLAPWGARVLTRLRVQPSGAEPSPSVSLGFRPALLSYACYGSGLAIIGTGLWIVACALAGDSPAPPTFFVGAFAASWIVGYLAPGAPAGLGVREALLSAWFSTVLSPAHAVVLVFALRIATTLGDLINFLIGSATLTLASHHSSSKRGPP